MFHSARLKLTAWYLLIIMTISLSFSAVVYRDFTNEFGRGLRRNTLRFLSPEQIQQIPDDLKDRRSTVVIQGVPYETLFIDEEEIFRFVKERMILRLFIFNSTIILIAGASGYFLAGKTLRPIEDMLIKQKRFIADASHELRTPLTALRSELEVAQRTPKISGSEVKELIESNIQEVIKMQELINYLLLLSKYDKSHTQVPMSHIKLHEVVSSAIKTTRHKAKEKNIKIKPLLAEISIEANEMSVLELVTIIIDNAIKYTPKGGSIKVKLARKNKSAQIVVKDTGVGIAKEHLPHIFQRFWRADEARGKKTTDGYGIGLSIAKSIVEMHNGKISVASKVNEGTTFTITLPIFH